jgi:4-hydroxy-tetrahydrodipicolinate reductase
MKVLLIGYGKMGKEIEKILVQNGDEIIAKIDNDEEWEEFLKNNDKIIDVAIEFTSPDTVVENIYRCFNLNIPIVVGTTAWYKNLPEIRKYAVDNDKTLFYSSNFSIGVNIFWDLNKNFAANYHFGTNLVRIKETHHIQKKDKPSGTAITMAEKLIEAIDEKKKWELQDEENFVCDSSIIPIEAIREDDINGIHSVIYETENDIIEIRHEAKSRASFATGAVAAAQWLIGKCGVFSMDEFLSFGTAQISRQANKNH